jgi:lysophospholipase L1-like esterase
MNTPSHSVFLRSRIVFRSARRLVLLCCAGAPLAWGAPGDLMDRTYAPADVNPLSQPASSAKTRFIAPSDPRFRYKGRFDTVDTSRPGVVWEASTISIDFEGAELGVRFGGVKGQVFFDARVDDSSAVLALHEGSPPLTLTVPVRGTGRHHLVLFKRTEASAGSAHFEGIEVAPDAGVFADDSPAPKMKMLIVGDSITAGACDEDGPKDQWEDRSTHNAAYSWAALTAAAFSADYQNISISGIGLAAGYDDVLIGQVWDRTYPSASAPKANLNAFVPDVVLVLLGDNDDSFPRDHHLPFPSNFGSNYASFIQSLRVAYPKSEIVLLNGAMWAGIHSPELGAAWGTVVRSLEAGDPAISHYTFAHWTSNHPRVSDHKALADELDTWLGKQHFMNSN